MEIRRTANAGVLLRLDDVTILLDGVCREVNPYPATPPRIRVELLRDPADVVAFTHAHEDHYDPAFVTEYLQKAAGPILGPADIPFSREEDLQIGGVKIRAVASHHMGKTEPMGHRSYIIEGSKCVWFMGDASPLHWPEKNLPKPDVLLAPYGFAMGRGWEITKELNPGVLVLLHLPDRSKDIYSLWDSVEKTVGCKAALPVLTPGMGDTIRLF